MKNTIKVAAAIVVAFASAAIGQQISGGGGGGGTPGGSDTQVQYNNAGAFGGNANLIWDNTNKFLKIASGSSSNPGAIIGPQTGGSGYGGLWAGNASPGGGSYFLAWSDSGADNYVKSLGDLALQASSGSINLQTPKTTINGGFQSVGTVPGISGCSAGTQTGGAIAGTFTIGATSCSVTLSFAMTAATGWSCHINDRTTQLLPP